MVFPWKLSDNKCHQVSRTLLSILVDLSNAIDWIVSTRSLISKSSSLFTNSLVRVPRALITIGTTTTSMFHSFSQFPSKVQVLILLFAFFLLYSVVSRDSKVHNSASSLFLLLIIVRSDRLAKIRLSICMSRSQRSFYVSFYRTDVGFCIYHLFVWSN